MGKEYVGSRGRGSAERESSRPCSGPSQTKEGRPAQPSVLGKERRTGENGNIGDERADDGQHDQVQVHRTIL